MKNNTLFLIVMLALLITGLGALYYQYQMGELELGSSDLTATPVPTARVEQKADTATPAATETDAGLEQMPTVSDSTDLETIEQELEGTIILEENFSDLE